MMVTLASGPALTTDCVCLNHDGRMLLIRPKYPPRAKGLMRLPGGFVEVVARVEAACAREVAEETELTAAKLRLIGIFSGSDRDARRPTVAIACLPQIKAAPPCAAAAEWISDWRALEFAFDHAEIILAAEAVLKRPKM